MLCIIKIKYLGNCHILLRKYSIDYIEGEQCLKYLDTAVVYYLMEEDGWYGQHGGRGEQCRAGSVEWLGHSASSVTACGVPSLVSGIMSLHTHQGSQLTSWCPTPSPPPLSMVSPAQSSSFSYSYLCSLVLSQLSGQF